MSDILRSWQAPSFWHIELFNVFFVYGKPAIKQFIHEFFFSRPETEQDEGGVTLWESGTCVGVCVCLCLCLRFGPPIVSRWDGKWDVLAAAVLTLAAAVGSRYGKFNELRSGRVTDSGKAPGALSVFECKTHLNLVKFCCLIFLHCVVFFCVCLHWPWNNLSAESLILPNYGPEKHPPSIAPFLPQFALFTALVQPIQLYGKTAVKTVFNNPLHHPGWGGSWLFS